MKYLLDTHCLLWAIADPAQLSPAATQVLQDSSSPVFISPITLWEISLKFSMGKLSLTGRNPEDIPNAVETLGFAWLPLEADVAASFHRLPKTEHHDPFDRMLVWQAICAGLVFVSKDRALRCYAKHGLKLLW